MEKGYLRRVDELGRVVLPVELRRTLDICERDRVEVGIEGERIYIQKVSDKCIFCGSERALTPFRDRWVCRTCRMQLSEEL